MKPRKDVKVVIGFPHGDKVSARYRNCLVRLLHYDMWNHGRIMNGGGDLPNSSGANVTNARNEVVRKFLDEHDADYLLCLDTDMTFEPDVIDRLVEVAHPTLRPIVGALCFSIQDGVWATPTTYTIRPDNHVGRVYDLPEPDGVHRLLTGTGCLLIHRSVLEAMRQRFPKPYEWFQETAFGDVPIGEDITFCIRAEGMGFPVHVDTRIDVGHEKPFIVGREMYEAQRRAGHVEQVDDVPDTFVVIPVKHGEREEMTAALVVQLAKEIPAEHIHVARGDEGITDKWIAGWEWAREQAEGRPFNVAFLNNDLIVCDDFLRLLASGLRQRADHWIAYPDVHGIGHRRGEVRATTSDALAGQTMSGFAFMVRGEAPVMFDEQFAWWYSDSDIERQVRAMGKQTVCVGGCYVQHLHPMESTKNPERLAQAKEDERRFAAKWGIDPDSLWLAQHPDFGAEVTV